MHFTASPDLTIYDDDVYRGVELARRDGYFHLDECVLYKPPCLTDLDGHIAANPPARPILTGSPGSLIGYLRTDPARARCFFTNDGPARE